MLRIHNVHEREIDGSVDEVHELLDDLDSVWPTEIWAAPQPEGEALRIGPMLWQREEREGSPLAFRVVAPPQLDAEHWFETTPYRGGTTLRHTVTGSADGSAEAVWQQIEPLHDRIMEAIFDKVEVALA
jgi:hypothetical protein